MTRYSGVFIVKYKSSSPRENVNLYRIYSRELPLTTLD